MDGRLVVRLATAIAAVHLASPILCNDPLEAGIVALVLMLAAAVTASPAKNDGIEVHVLRPGAPIFHVRHKV